MDGTEVTTDWVCIENITIGLCFSGVSVDNPILQDGGVLSSAISRGIKALTEMRMVVMRNAAPRERAEMLDWTCRLRG